MESNINFQKKNLFRNLIIKTCLVLFLSLIVYISYFGFKKKYQPLFLSKFQFNQSKGNQNLLQNSSDVVNYSYASSLSRCGLGQCVIDIESGVKRCPETVGAGPLIYDILTEACTNLESCDYEDIPFAVKTDGSADSNMCEISPNGERIPCRCSDKKACKPHVVSKFKTIEGKTFGFQENYAPEKLVIAQEISTDQSHLGFYNIPIENSAEEFCEINPAFTEEIVNGCNFKNSLGDKLGCEFIETLNFTGVNASPMGWQLSEQIGGLVDSIPGYLKRPSVYGDSKNVVEGQEYVILGVPLGQWVNQDDQNLNLRLPGVVEVNVSSDNPPILPYGGNASGFIKFTPESGGNTEIVSYDFGIIPTGYGYPSIRSQDYIFAILYNIISVYTSPLVPNRPPGTKGFAFGHEENIKGDKGGPGQLTVITQQLMTSTFCRFTNDTANYKNMLLCTREQNEVCNYGRLSYNIENLGGLDINNMDENYSRNFCQLNMQRRLDNINLKYLNDPINHTMSCSLGPGCDGKYFQQPTDDVSVEAKNRYFPEVDIDGINGVWDITIDTFPTLVDGDGGLDKGNQLLNIENINPGDYWSIKSVNEVLLASEDVEKGSSIIPVEDLFGLNIFIGQEIRPSVAPTIAIGTSSYLLSKATYEFVNNQNFSSIGISPVLSTNITKYESINIVAANVNRGDTYGIVIQKENTNSYKSFYKVNSPLNDSPRYEFARLDGVPIDQNALGNRVSLTVYKQFSFSGGNYGTKVMKNLTGIGSGYYGKFNRRLYTNEKNQPYVFKVFDIPKQTYPYPPQDLNQLDLNQVGIADPTKNTSFDSISAPYKIPMSMYYPVWNKALGQQECVRCKPIFIAHSVINFLDKLENVIIQFSGKDFGNYQYNARDDMYCYVTTSKAKFDNINKADITSRRIVLQEPNLNIEKGDYVLDSTLQLPFQIYTSKDFADFQTTTFKRLQICPQIFPSDEAVRNMKDTKGGQVVHDNWNKTNNNQGNGKAADVYPFSFGLDESTSENFVFEGNTLFPNQEGTISKNGNTYTFVNTGASLPNNYFFGKKYQDASLYNGKLMEKIEQASNPEIYTDGFYFVPTSQVESISDDGTVIVLSSSYPYKITNPRDDVYFQFCRLDDNLEIKVAYPSKEATDEFEEVYPDTEVKINAITDSRISDVIVTKSSSNFSKSNPPIIKLDLENQNFI